VDTEGEITADHAAFIRKITIAALLAQPLPNRLNGERETQYVARVIRPIVSSALQKYPALVCHGEGGLRAHEVSYAGFTFVPDVSVSHFQQRILAIEAKFLVAGQDSVSEALGQASIYAFAGYLCSIALVLRNVGPLLQDAFQVGRSDGSTNFVDLLLVRTVFE
jgi:hypothetical protein